MSAALGDWRPEQMFYGLAALRLRIRTETSLASA